jgi:hypothetical protein
MVSVPKRYCFIFWGLTRASQTSAASAFIWIDFVAVSPFDIFLF